MKEGIDSFCDLEESALLKGRCDGDNTIAHEITHNVM
jgi:hypothetical protein